MPEFIKFIKNTKHSIYKFLLNFVLQLLRKEHCLYWPALLDSEVRIWGDSKKFVGNGTKKKKHVYFGEKQIPAFLNNMCFLSTFWRHLKLTVISTGEYENWSCTRLRLTDYAWTSWKTVSHLRDNASTMLKFRLKFFPEPIIKTGIFLSYYYYYYYYGIWSNKIL